MRKVFIALAASVTVGGCTFVGAFVGAALDCEAGETCVFRNAPLELTATTVTFPDRPFVYRRTLNEVQYVDRTGKIWAAPTGTITDGATIPPVFVPLIGAPTSAEFAIAAAIHDAYCGFGNEDMPRWQARDWRAVHRMFFEALVIGGTPENKAKAMYAAVMTGGPRWGVGAQDANGEYLPNGTARPELAQVPAAELQAAFQDMLAYIEREDPTLDQIDGVVEIVSGSAEGRSGASEFRPEEEAGFEVLADGTVVEWRGLPPPAPPGSESSWLGYDAEGNWIGIDTQTDTQIPKDTDTGAELESDPSREPEVSDPLPPPELPDHTGWLPPGAP